MKEIDKSSSSEVFSVKLASPTQNKIETLVLNNSVHYLIPHQLLNIISKTH
jgi:hypothetical protein